MQQQNIVCLELAFKTSKISFWIFVAQFLDISAEITGTDLSITTCNSFKKSIMDEDVLFLHYNIMHVMQENNDAMIINEN